MNASLGWFAITRILGGGIGLVWVLLLARWMAVQDFAAYSVLLAAVTVSSIVGTLGIDRVLYRQMPAAHLAGALGDVRRLAVFALLARLSIAPAAAMGIMYFTRPETSALALPAALTFSAVLAASLVLTDVVSTTANALLRFEAQAYILSAGTLAKLVTAGTLHLAGVVLTAPRVLVISLVGDLLVSAAMYLWVVRPELGASSSAPATPGAVAYETPPFAVLAKSALTNYASYLLSLPWQGPSLTVLVGATAGVSEVALFALLQNLMDRMRQYLPLQLLQNAFEPMLVRHYSATGDRRAVADQLELLRRANFCILIGVAACCLPCAGQLIALVTNGKYSGGGPLATLMVAALALRGIVGVLFISANVMNEMGRLTRVNAVSTALLLAPLFWTAQQFGTTGVVAISALPSVLLWAGLRLGGAQSAIGVWHLGKDVACVAAGVVASGIGWLVLGWMGNDTAGSIVAVAVILLFYGLGSMVFKVFDAKDLSMLSSGLRSQAT